MAYDFSTLRKRAAEIEAWLKKEYVGIRTGRANAAMLDSVQVISYGVRLPLEQVANVAAQDARTLRITPYDISQIKEIEKAITDADLGVGVGSDEQGVRVSFPELTSDRRQALIKIIKGKAEEARISLRAERDKVWDDVQKKEKDKEISTDEKFHYKEQMQEIIDTTNKHLDEMVSRKERELSS